MKTQIIFLLLSFFSLAGIAQNVNQVKIDDRVEGEILCGQINLDGLKDSLCSEWFKPEFEAYKIDANLLSDLKKKKLSGLKMTLVLGTWCHDSHQQVPRLIKLLEAMKFPMSKLDMFAIDTYKEASGVDVKALDLKLVPTLIVYKGAKELGRIVETPKASLEADLLEILQ